jgi:hypothetical protein
MQPPVEIIHHSVVVEQDRPGTFAAIIAKDSYQIDPPSPLAEGGLKEIKLERIDPRVIQTLLLTHPVVPRGIDLKVNRMITLGGTRFRSRIEISKSPFDKDGNYWKYCKDLYYNSGGDRLLKRWVKDGYGYGNGYLLGLLNRTKSKIVKYKMKHPVYFNFDKEEKQISSSNSSLKIWKIKLDRHQEPEGYRDYFVNSENKLVPDGRRTLVDPWRVAHLKFDTWGDEWEGVSIMQYIHLLVKYMLNMEEDGALEVKHFGHLKYKYTTKFRSLDDVKAYAKEVAQMTVNDAIVLTDGGDADILAPKGGGPFAEYYDKYMTLLAIRLGIPKDILETTGRNSNNAIMDQLRQDMFDDIASDEVEISQTMRDNLFTPACALLFGGDPLKPKADFDHRKVPYLRFKTRKEDLDKSTTIFLKQARGIQAIANSIGILGKNQELLGKARAKEVIDKIIELIPTKQSVDIPGGEADEELDKEIQERQKEE